MSVPAGWYDDGSGRQRWWDGEQWTEHYAPESAASPVAGDAAEPSDSPAGEDLTPDARASTEPHSDYLPPAAPGAAEGAHPTEAYPAVTPEGYPQSAYGQPPYGQDPYAQAGFGQQGYPGAAGVDPQNPYAAPAPYGSAPSYAGAYSAPDAGPRKTPLLGYIGLGLAVVGGIIACIPNFVTFGIGSFLLFAAFVVSIIALFIKNTAKWPGIVGLILSIVMGVVATIVLSVTLFATAMSDGAWDSSYDPYATDEPWAEPAPEPSATDDATDEAIGGRPSPEELAVGLEEMAGMSEATGYSDELLLCLGQEFYDSDLSDEALQRVAEGTIEFSDQADAAEFGNTFTDAASACAQQQ
ncbi:hypothetical protein CW368_09710 [Actinomycetales bacterium SN12]|nr:hypothetical protein CW368_09710 [Actinomycetales bacterium SN12]